MRNFLIISFLLPVVLMAQQPFISGISPTHTTVGETVTITGTNLGGSVYFGGVEASSVSGSGNTMTAVVPAGATHGVITVVNSGLVAQSSQRFFISFNGSTLNTYDDEFLVATGETDVYDICMCDLNDDGLNDLAIAHNVQSSDNSDNEATIYTNNTDTDAYVAGDFAQTQSINEANNNTGFISVSCGDLNKDGIPELIYSTNAVTNPRDVFIYTNTAVLPAINMTISASFKLPPGSSGNRKARRTKVADIDGDGNPDLVVGNESDEVLFIYPGNGDLTFNAPVEVTVSSTINTSSIDLADFNNDGRVDIVSLPFREQNEVITILQNNSQPGNFSFEQAAGISTSAQRINVKAADFDEDGFIDIVATNQQLQRVAIHRNTTTSSGSEITFASATNISLTGAGPWGVDIGDMNGDGKPDVVVGSTSTIDDLYVIENNSTSGTLTFATPTAIETTNTNQNLAVGDLNGDARPDIAFTHNIQLGNTGNLGIFLNRNCVEPVITPNNIEFCYNDPFTAFTTKTAGATYLWEIVPPATGTITSPNADNTLIEIDGTSPATSSVRVTITHDVGEPYECSEVQAVSYNLIGGVQPATPTITGPGSPICFGDPFTLNVVGGLDEYLWTLPDGSTVTSSQINVTSATVEDAGSYSVRVKSTGSCFSDESVDFIVEVSQAPLFEILNDNLDNFCVGTSVTLSVPDFTGDFGYQWQRNGTDLGTADATSASVSVNQSGNYSVEITDTNTCTTETANYTVNAITSPSSVANGPTETCVDFETSFTSASTGESGFTLQYEWVVEDDMDVVIHTANTPDLDYTFTSTGNFEVILTTSYDVAEVYGGPASAVCQSSDPIAVSVVNPPTIEFSVADGTSKCQAEALNISLNSPNSANITTYEWNVLDIATGDTVGTGQAASIDVSTPVGVDDVNVVVRITTDIGCIQQDTVSINNFPTNVDISSPDDDVSTDIVTLETANFIRLSAENFTSITSWSPGDIFDDSTATSVTVFPNQPSTTITLTGVDNNDCTVSTEIEIILDNLRPKRTFSPNGDGMNDCWEILNSSQPNTAGCKIYVFDSRGRNIKVAEAPFDNNCVWDGNSNGSPVPEGVYYYVLKCDGNGLSSKSGSILLAR